MNTKSKQDQKTNQRQEPQLRLAPKKQGKNHNMLHQSSTIQEHEHPEMRLTR
jgi:hypothetical protein